MLTLTVPSARRPARRVCGTKGRCAAQAPSAEEVREALNAASGSNREAARDARQFRRSLNKTGRYTRRVVDDAESLEKMESDGVGYSRKGLVAQMRQNGNKFTYGDVTVSLAQAYGFCWGVERAVQMAYEARARFPESQLHITNEIIHNPGVNQRMHDMNVKFIEAKDDTKDFSGVENGDVVILPAFGASVEEMRLLNDRGVQIIDTTCPWVSKVWTAVDRQADKAHTSIIHGKYSHEETVATASFAGDYLIIKDLEEAKYVADFILNGGDKEEFMSKFTNAMSEGFDVDTMLERVGIANQTTMLKGETEAIGKLFEKTMMQKYGPEALKEHFMVMDTICDATQERQDAMYELTGGEDAVDVMLVVGGFNSSNTSHLQEIAEHKGIPSFWVCAADCIDVAANKIQHKTSWGELKETEGWLTPGQPLRVGVTSGASTPDSDVETVLDRVFAIMHPDYEGIKPLDKPVDVVAPTH
uniref:4-hydroxy-3-methylbut-2-enyl diphosphate reductase n=1 Tax=Ulva prolifera TaxID=3117 RepID=A0A482JNI7_ULVPR|nr:plastid 4-hydroxy-3-methylbut-2-enyldisphosphate reductase [Ulva prolifera]